MTTVIVVCEGRTEMAFVENPDTHPSARLRQLKPEYKKVAHGVAVTTCAGLHRIRAECRHFDRWLTCIEGLPAVASMA